MTDFRPVTFSLLYRAIPKANKHKIARRGFGRNARRQVVNDLTGCVAAREKSFATRALACMEMDERAMLPFDCPLEAHVVFVYTPPAKPKWKREAALSGLFLYTKTPDLDNVAKFVFDALEHVFYTDDKLIYKETLEKRYGPEERVIVTLRPRLQLTRDAWKEISGD